MLYQNWKFRLKFSASKDLKMIENQFILKILMKEPATLSDYTRLRNKHKEQSRKTKNMSQMMKKRSRVLKTPNSKASPSTVKTATHTPSSRNNRSDVGIDSHRESSRRRPKTSGLSGKQGGLLFSQRQKHDRNSR